MKKLLISLAAATALCAGSQASADNRSFMFYDEDENPAYGVLRRVSPNGLWAAGGDEEDETGSYLINTSDPENYIFNEDGMLLDVDDNGMCVGAYYERIGGAKYKRAAIFRNGEWTRLELPKKIIGQSYAVALSADSKTIAGHGMCQNSAPDEPGKYFPIIWRLDEATGEYKLDRLYNNLWLPGTFGFFVEDMTPDAKIICGYQCLNMSDIICAMMYVETGEYKVWHTLEEKEFEFEYMGTTYYSEGLFVDGMLDGFDEWTRFEGRLCYATDRYIFGSRSLVRDVQEDGSAVLDHYGAVYDIKTGEFIDVATNCVLTCGLAPDQTFTNNGMMIEGQQLKVLTVTVGTGDPVDIVYGIDPSGRVLAGAFAAYTPWGEPYESPILVLLDETIFAGVDNVKSDQPSNRIKLVGRTISVEGSPTAEVYTPNGILVAKGNNLTVAPGMYVVNAEGVSQKIIVK